MGTMIQATCACGYASDVLLEGCGMAGPQTCSDLARCDHCREVVTVYTGSVRRRCRKCRRKVVVMSSAERTADTFEKTWPAADLECPRCHQLTMRLEMVGLWD